MAQCFCFDGLYPLCPRSARRSLWGPGKQRGRTAPIRGLPEVEGRELIAEILERVRGADGGRNYPHHLWGTVLQGLPVVGTPRENLNGSDRKQGLGRMGLRKPAAVGARGASEPVGPRLAPVVVWMRGPPARKSKEETAGRNKEGGGSGGDPDLMSIEADHRLGSRDAGRSQNTEGLQHGR